jgi:hypothetical protein
VALRLSVYSYNLMSQSGKFGLACVGASREGAILFYDKTKEVLFQELGAAVGD